MFREGIWLTDCTCKGGKIRLSLRTLCMGGRISVIETTMSPTVQRAAYCLLVEREYHPRPGEVMTLSVIG
jgi:hypothetical protein